MKILVWNYMVWILESKYVDVNIFGEHPRAQVFAKNLKSFVWNGIAPFFKLKWSKGIQYNEP